MMFLMQVLMSIGIMSIRISVHATAVIKDDVPTLPSGQVKLIKSNVKTEGILFAYRPEMATLGCLASPAVDLERYLPLRDILI